MAGDSCVFVVDGLSMKLQDYLDIRDAAHIQTVKGRFGQHVTKMPS
jgi:hypothetical protein